MNRGLSLIPLALAMLMLMAACGVGAADPPTPTPTSTPSTGTIEGTVIVGPLCPVEPCTPPIDPYAGRDLLLTRPGASTVHVPLNPDGSFEAEVPPGVWEMQLEDCVWLGCTREFPREVTVEAGKTTTVTLEIDTGIRSPGVSEGVDQLIADLSAAGAVVARGDSVTQPFFQAAGQIITVDREDVQVFVYPTAEAAQADADLVSESGSSVGTTMVTWMAVPHFYLRGNVMVLYVGHSDAVAQRLESVLGPMFAGGGAPVFTGSDAMTEEYLGVLETLADALENVAASGGTIASVDRVLTLIDDVRPFADYFSSLTQEQAADLGRQYGDRIADLAVRISAAALPAIDASGDQRILEQLQSIPPFAIATHQETP